MAEIGLHLFVCPQSPCLFLITRFWYTVEASVELCPQWFWYVLHSILSSTAVAVSLCPQLPSLSPLCRATECSPWGRSDEQCPGPEWQCSVALSFRVEPPSPWNMHISIQSENTSNLVVTMELSECHKYLFIFFIAGIKMLGYKKVVQYKNNRKFIGYTSPECVCLFGFSLASSNILWEIRFEQRLQRNMKAPTAHN